jgi:16S rRNA (cytidine1402-2'-O)-methyltransferase
MICDPGSLLVEELIKNNISVTALAGACAVPTFLSQVPRSNEFFTFGGFFPKTAQQAKDLLLKHSKTNFVFYDSPNRILDTLSLIKQVRGEVKVSLGRELTKLYEEVRTDDVSNMINYFKDGIKGEIVCMVHADEKDDDISDIKPKIELLKSKGYKSKEISVILSTLYDVNKNDVYKAII